MHCAPKSVALFALLLSSACATGVVDGPADKTGSEGTTGPTDLDTHDPDSADSADTADSGDLVPTTPLEDVLTQEALLGHLDALQAIADTHDHTRYTFGDGYKDSVAYAVSVFENAGYTVTQQTFTLSGFDEDSPPELSRIAPDSRAYPGADLRTLTYSAGGDVTAALAAVDVVMPPGASSNSSTSGCQASDFDGFPAGSVALIQRGSCSFSEKVQYAEAAGAVAVLIYNEGQSGRQAVESWTLDPGIPVRVPVLGTSFDVGADLYAALEAGPVEVRVVVDAGIVEESVTNVLAELDRGDPDQLVVVGAHLDSVTAGPGINDNGTGTAFVLAAAEAAVAVDLHPERRIRWALWGAEEIGLIGSDHYVSELSSADINRHYANLNFDMIGSPNGGRFIYDGDGSATGYAGPPGSDDIEALFEAWFDSQGLTHLPTAFDGRSDYGPFIWAGIPAGGLFSGAEVSKSSTEADLFGGRAGEPLDACYHQDCDSRSNIDETLFYEMSLAAAHVTRRVAEGTAAMGPPPPVRVPHPRIDPHTVPLGHGHGHGCHPVDR